MKRHHKVRHLAGREILSAIEADARDSGRTRRAVLIDRLQEMHEDRHYLRRRLERALQRERDAVYAMSELVRVNALMVAAWQGLRSEEDE